MGVIDNAREALAASNQMSGVLDASWVVRRLAQSGASPRGRERDMSVCTRCERRGHRWRVLGFDPANSVFRAMVFLRCTRCHEGITAEILSVGNGSET